MLKLVSELVSLRLYMLHLVINVKEVWIVCLVFFAYFFVQLVYLLNSKLLLNTDLTCYVFALRDDVYVRLVVWQLLHLLNLVCSWTDFKMRFEFIWGHEKSLLKRTLHKIALSKL